MVNEVNMVNKENKVNMVNEGKKGKRGKHGKCGKQGKRDKRGKQGKHHVQPRQFGLALPKASHLSFCSSNHGKIQITTEHFRPEKR